MARGTSIEGFAEKLRLALGRANLSRTALAQRIGVDKSVVARWSSGALNPADHSLAALSDTLGQAIPGFDRTAWDLPMLAFAERIGVAAPGCPGARRATGPLDALLAESRDGVAQAARSYAGLWLILYPAIGRPGELHGNVGRIHLSPGNEALTFEFTNGTTVHGVGIALAMQARLHLVFHSLHLHDTVGLGLFDGVSEETAHVLDGIVLSRTAMAERAIGAGRTLLFRLSDATDDASLQAAATRSTTLNIAGAWEGMATPGLRDAFVQLPTGGPIGLRQVRVGPAESWSLGDRGLRRPGAAPQREALAAMRAAFRTVVPRVLD